MSEIGPNQSISYPATLLSLHEGGVASSPVKLPQRKIDMVSFSNRLAEIGRTARIITDPMTGMPFEIAIANPDAPEESYDAEISTFTSSIGIGNAIELAENAACNPTRKRVYIANFGNGGTAYFDLAEQKYIRQTGRYTVGDADSAVSLPSIQALGRALEHNGINISRLSAVSSGDSVSMALMTELPANQVTDAYLKGPLNIVDYRAIHLIYEMLFTEDVLNSRKNARESTDEWKPDDTKKDIAKIALWSLRNPDRLPKPAGVFEVSKRQKFLTDVLGFTKGEFSGDPAVVGLVAALNAQTRAMVTLHCGTQDVLYRGKTLEAATGVLERAVMLGGAALVEPRLQAIVMEGSHADHTQEPSKRMAAEAASFGRLLTRHQ
jgi:hypothetical protein